MEKELRKHVLAELRATKGLDGASALPWDQGSRGEQRLGRVGPGTPGKYSSDWDATHEWIGENYVLRTTPKVKKKK